MNDGAARFARRVGCPRRFACFVSRPMAHRFSVSPLLGRAYAAHNKGFTSPCFRLGSRFRLYWAVLTQPTIKASPRLVPATQATS